MALITGFFENPIDRPTRHTEVECGWSVVESPSGRLLQLDTFGSTERKFVGKKSQTLQLDTAAAAELLTIIKRTFPDIARTI